MIIFSKTKSNSPCQFLLAAKGGRHTPSSFSVSYRACHAVALLLSSQPAEPPPTPLGFPLHQQTRFPPHQRRSHCLRCLRRLRHPPWRCSRRSNVMPASPFFPLKAFHHRGRLRRHVDCCFPTTLRRRGLGWCRSFFLWWRVSSEEIAAHYHHLHLHLHRHRQPCLFLPQRRWK